MTATSQTAELATRVDADVDDDDAGLLAGGTRIGRYVVLDKVGQGGMGFVYTAYDPELDRKIAIKLLRPRAGVDGQARMLREAQAMAKIAHPNTVAIYDVGLFGGRVFLAMELVGGVTLGDWLAVEKRSWRDIVALMIEAGRGLAAAHEAGLAHRDFKPSNVLVDASGRPKVTDFGLARRAVATGEIERVVEADDNVAHAVRLSEPRLSEPRLSAPRLSEPNVAAPRLSEPNLAEPATSHDPSDGITRVGAVIGTPAYMAPEQRRGAPPDLRTDQYSFGVTLFEALYGKRPERRDTVRDDGEPRTVVEPPATKHVPRRIASVVKRALSERPQDRYPSMQALLADLSRDPSVKLRRALLVAAVPAVLVGGMLASRLLAHDDNLVCSIDADRLRGVWDDSIKRQINTSFAATKSRYAAQSYERTSTIIDAYTDNWLAMRQEACSATRVRGEQPETVMSLRMMCLDRAESQLRALTSVLVTADAGTVERASQAASALPRLSECADVQLLARDHGQPSTPFDLGQISARAQVARLSALYETGRYAEGLAAASAFARELGDDQPRFAAENAYIEGQILFARGKLDAAIAAFERSSIAAERGSYPLYVARAYGRLAFVYACPKQDIATAERYDQHADAVMKAIGGDALAETWRLTGVACIRDAQNDDAGSTDAVSRALAVYEHAYGRDAVYATLLTTLGASLSRDPARALRAIDDAIATQEALLGDHHPKLSFSLTVRAQQLMWLGRYSEAITSISRAIEIREQTVTGPDRLLGSSYANYARILRESGDLDKALVMAQRSVEIRKATAGKDGVDTLEANVVTLSINALRGEDVISALEDHLAKLAAALHDKADLDLSVLEARLALATAYRNANRVKDAARISEQALAGAEQRRDPRLIATCQLALAQSLAAGDRERARTLATAAQRGFTAIGNAAKASEVERWLAAH